MRRTGAILLAAIALAAPAVSHAGATRQYEGAVTGVADSRVAFSVVKRDGARRVRSIVIERVPLGCEEGHSTSADVAGTKGSARVRDGHFRFVADDGTRSFRISGEVHRHRASGSLRIAGTFDVDGEQRYCGSGKLEWRAARD